MYGFTLFIDKKKSSEASPAEIAAVDALNKFYLTTFYRAGGKLLINETQKPR